MKKKNTVVVETISKEPNIVRDNKGKFAKGNVTRTAIASKRGKSALSPTREFFIRLKDYRAAMQQEITPEDMREIMRHMIETACTDGARDAVPAARFVYSYAIGEAVRYDFEKLDKEMQQDMEKVFDVIPMEKLIELAR